MRRIDIKTVMAGVIVVVTILKAVIQLEGQELKRRK